MDGWKLGWMERSEKQERVAHSQGTPLQLPSPVLHSIPELKAVTQSGWLERAEHLDGQSF